MTTDVISTARVQFRDYYEQLVTYNEVCFVATTMIFKLQGNIVFAVNCEEFRSLTMLAERWEVESDD